MIVNCIIRIGKRVMGCESWAESHGLREKSWGRSKGLAYVRKVLYKYSPPIIAQLRILKSKSFTFSFFLISIHFTNEKLNSVYFSLFSSAWFDETSERCILRATAITLPDHIMNVVHVQANAGCVRLQERGGVGLMWIKADMGTSFMDDPLSDL